MKRGAIFFDFDGLLVDTETPEYAAWREIYSTYGVSLPVEDWAVCIGTMAQVFDPIKYLEERIGGSLPRQELEDRHKERFYELAFAEPLMPGVPDRLREADEMGLSVGVVSSSRIQWVREHLTRRGIFDRFECVKTFEDVSETKPSPELYLKAIEEIGIAPRQGVALEDSTNGVRAAKAAGLYCVAIPNEMTQGLSMDGADRKANSLTEISLGEIFGEIG